MRGRGQANTTPLTAIHVQDLVADVPAPLTLTTAAASMGRGSE